jgi:MFS family permease
MGRDDAAPCPLPRPAQTRNLLIFAACTGLTYLAAPVSYVGPTQASLCRELQVSDTVANLPAAAFFAMTAMPVVLAWYLPYVRYLRRNLVGCYAISAAALAGVAAVIASEVPDAVKVAAVIVQGALAGAFMPAATAFLWELLGRGVDESRRGMTLSLAFGAGPVLAVVGSFAAQLLLTGRLLDGRLTAPTLAFPWNYAALFGAAAPLMALAALLCSRAVVPLPDQDLTREPFLHGVFGGFRAILADRVLRIATVVTLLFYVGNTIASNMNLYSSEALGDTPQNYAGQQLAIRFAFKVVAGLLLGWVLTRTNPKAGVLVTGAIYLSAQLWAMLFTGQAYLVAFGLYGAGELIGVYAPNYILSASPQMNIRRNMAFVTMLMAPTAPAGLLFGAISDHFGTSDPAAGYRASFAVCAAVLAAGLLIAAVYLPARPGRPPEGG